ncbi:hypothetical protein VNO80_33108 [Phaseolus coccineus]|uniref:Uncharacterized protein n=1 Tax=Phaseolus coccineus TaxID=3886 RepID=A0AAN9L3I1_PHACN
MYKVDRCLADPLLPIWVGLTQKSKPVPGIESRRRLRILSDSTKKSKNIAYSAATFLYASVVFGLRPAETIDSQAEKAIDGRIGTGTRAILGPTKPCHEQSTQPGDIETKTHSVYCSTFLQQIELHRLFLFLPAKLAADSTSPLHRVYALFVLASAIERE